MQDSDLPPRIPLPFATNAGAGYVRTIPRTTTTPGAASFDTGFPPINFTAISAGGIPPDGQDENGILLNLSQWARWQAAGGPAYYDATFATDPAVGGYPKGAVLTATSVNNAWWLSLVDNNTSDPDNGGANWLLINLNPQGAQPYWIAVKSRTTASPPVSPTDGDRYLVPVGAIAGWTGKDNLIAQWSASLGAWIYVDYPTASMTGVASETYPRFYTRMIDGTWQSIWNFVDSDSFFLGMM